MSVVEEITKLYEDEDIVVINKPAGLIVHPFNATDTQDSVTQWLVREYPESATVGDEPASRPGIVHRLDKTTSGILLLARTQKGYDTLKEQFKERTISKEYRALVSGEPKADSGEITAAITRSKKAANKMRTARGSEKGRDARTSWVMIERFEDAALLGVMPKTGRTHQIRVHLHAIHHPIIGDDKYGHKNMDHHGMQRPFLHAYALEFVTTLGDRLKLEAGMPQDLIDVLTKLRAQND